MHSTISFSSSILLVYFMSGLICIHWICFLPQKRFAEAKEVYLEGIEKCPDSSDLHNNYGVFLVDTGELNPMALWLQGWLVWLPFKNIPSSNLDKKKRKKLILCWRRSSQGVSSDVILT